MTKAEAEILKVTDEKRLIPVSEAARLVPTTERRIRSAIDKGQLQARKVGGGVMVECNSFRRLLGLDPQAA